MTENDEGNLFTLFNGTIAGIVRNPLNGKEYLRKDILNHYRFLIGRSIDEPANLKYRRLLRLMADILEIPGDIHNELIKEAWRNRAALGNPVVNFFINTEMDALYDHIVGARSLPKDQVEEIPPDGTENHETHGILDHYRGIFDDDMSSTYSLLSEMKEEDISLDVESKVLEPSIDSPFSSSGWIKNKRGHSFK